MDAATQALAQAIMDGDGVNAALADGADAIARLEAATGVEWEYDKHGGFRTIDELGDAQMKTVLDAAKISGIDGYRADGKFSLGHNSDNINDFIDYCNDRGAPLLGGAGMRGVVAENGMSTQTMSEEDLKIVAASVMDNANIISDADIAKIRGGDSHHRIGVPKDIGQVIEDSIGSDITDVKVDVPGIDYVKGVDGTAYTAIITGITEGKPSINFNTDGGVTIGETPIVNVFGEIADPAVDNIQLVNAQILQPENNIVPDMDSANDISFAIKV